MTTSTSNKLFKELGASSSSVGASSTYVDVDYMTLAVASMQGIEHLVRSGVQLNERQCQDLYSKLVKIVENIQKLVPHSRAFNIPFQLALKNFYKVLEKAKLLVDHCCSTDLCRASMFQVCNEEAFREILLEVGLCFNVIYELVEHIMRDWERRLFVTKDLRDSSLFLPAFESEVLQDQQALKSSLEHSANTSDDPNQCLARYLLGKLQCLYGKRSTKDFGMHDALLWVSETEPQESWKLLRVLGSGSGASCVCCYNWLDILCARKEFDGQVEELFFRREVAILAQLNHPNIVKFFCCSNGPEERQCFIAMELMEMSLSKLIKNRGKVGQMFPILVVLDIIIQIARGMCYLHGQNIAHRDLKPLNVVVTKLSVAHLQDNFCVKLVDFGVSKIKVEVLKSNTISIPGVGTTIYRAPEVFPQAQQVAPGGKMKVNWFQADAYSFAVTCAQLLSLKEPFQDVLRSMLYDELQRGQRPELPQGCPKDLAALLKECWATNPQGRPSFVYICSRLEKCKFQELLKESLASNFEGLQRPLAYEYIEGLLVKQCVVQSQGATTIPYDLDIEAICKSEDGSVVDPAGDRRKQRPVQKPKKPGLLSKIQGYIQGKSSETEQPKLRKASSASNSSAPIPTPPSGGIILEKSNDSVQFAEKLHSSDHEYSKKERNKVPVTRLETEGAIPSADHVRASDMKQPEMLVSDQQSPGSFHSPEGVPSYSSYADHVPPRGGDVKDTAMYPPWESKRHSLSPGNQGNGSRSGRTSRTEQESVGEAHVGSHTSIYKMADPSKNPRGRHYYARDNTLSSTRRLSSTGHNPSG